MRIEFENGKKDRKYSFIIHIVEHDGYGTLHQLVQPLQIEENQKVIFTHDMMSFRFNQKDNYILHVTGHMYPIISNLELLSKNGIRYSVFLHVAPKYYQFKKEKLLFLDYLENIQKRYNIKFFCPSENVAKQYEKIGINVGVIQIGIDRIQKQGKKVELKPYYDKYVTICTSPDYRYRTLKGVDVFASQMEKIKLKDKALILGFDGEYMGIKCRKFNHDDFLNILCNSKSYIQFSRTEAYNLTAVQAKQLKVPVLVSNVDGHIDCMKFKVNLYNNEPIISKLIQIRSKEVILKNFEESIKRESIKSFINSIIKNVEE